MQSDGDAAETQSINFAVLLSVVWPHMLFIVFHLGLRLQEAKRK